MGLTLSYPATLYRPQAPPDLSEWDTRQRLSPAAVRGFVRTMARWKVRDEDARTLVGGISNGTWYAWKKDPDRVLDADQLTRISLVLGIFAALHAVHSSEIADRWMRMPNSNRLFRGVTPLSFVLKGGVPALQLVRQLVEARRSGV